MTRRDFELIARALYNARPVASQDQDGDAARLRQWGATCESMADALAGASSAFNRARFMAACGA
jgi:hypothetical protein